MPIIITKDNGDAFIAGPPIGQPSTTALLKLFVGGRQHGPMLAPDGVAPLGVIGADERERRTDTGLPPLRMVCSLEVSFAEDEEPQPVATGWLVGPRTVVTAGHVLRWQGQEAKRVRVIPGRDGNKRPAGASESTAFHFHPEWTGSPDDQAGHDLAAIRLPERFKDTSWFGVAALTDPTLAGRFVNIPGYPSEADNADRGCVELWWHANHVKQLQPDRIFYDVDTSPGQSGAPVILWPDPAAPSPAAPTVIGIHARGFEDNRSFNGATRISPDTLTMLKGWIDEDTKA